MDPFQSRQTDHLGVNRMGRNIRKSPIHHPTFASSVKPHPHPHPQPQPQPQPHVYNINKNDFRELVQQLTGSPLRDPPSRPPQNQPRPPNNRLLRVRPPPLAPTNWPQVPVHHYPVMATLPAQPHPNNFVRSFTVQSDQPSPGLGFPPTPTDVWTNTTESPISVYMRYLQNSIINSPQAPQNMIQHQPSLLHAPALISPRFNAPPPATHSNAPLISLHSPQSSYVPALPLPHPNAPSFLPSPTSQFLLSSPTGFWNVSSPRSPYPLLSPGYHFPPPHSPSFSFSSLGPLTPSSPGYGFSSLPPSGFFPISSPR